MSKHTPGPWLYEGPASVGGPCIFATVKGRRWVVASCTSSRVWIGPPKEFEDAQPEAVANARLISAAPDLLEACKAVVASFERSDAELRRAGLNPYPVSHRPAYLSACLAAIAKAEGR